MNNNLESERERERERYNFVAKTQVVPTSRSNSGLNLADISEWYRDPYKKYYDSIKATIDASMVVLEMGAGCGNHTAVIWETKAKVIALDISENSLAVCQNIFRDVQTALGNMENMPLENNCVDAVLSCGSLSYGDNEKVKSEIFRVLKPGGSLIILDSLNHNLLYKMNRWIHYKRGHRTLSTLQRMPNKKLIQDLITPFCEVEITYYGSYLWLTLVLKKLIGNKLARNLNRSLEKWFPSKLGAFKFVLVCKKLDLSRI